MKTLITRSAPMDREQLTVAPLAWQSQGLQQTASGYGRRLTTQYKAPFNGRLYRVYCTQFSNAGSFWFEAQGVRYYIG